MKKTIYSTIAVAAVILAGGCSKETIPSGEGLTGIITFSAELSGNLTKTSVDGTNNTKVNWSADDSLSIWGGENNKFTLSSEAGKTSGSFSGIITSGSAQYALYPYNSTASINNGVITTNIPNTQTVSAGSFDPTAAIMVGTISGSTISFHHAAAYLKITAPSDVTNLVEITVESNGGVQLTGDAKFAATNGAFTATGTAKNHVTLRPAGGSFKADSIYYAAVIPGTYTGGLSVRYLYKTDATHLTEKTKSNSTSLEIAAGTAKLLGAATSFDHTYDAVQLWENGPFWATTNIGASSPTDYGQYFAWGYPTGQTPSGSTFSTSFDNSNYTDLNMSTLDSTHDMAAVNWGTGWSVPTEAQLKTLIDQDKSDNCSISYITTGSQGIRITGKKTGYTSNSIFLPAAGYGQTTMFYNDISDDNRYWSTSQRVSGGSYGLFFNIEDVEGEVGSFSKCCGFSVRPIREYVAPVSPAAPTTGTAKAKIGGNDVDVDWIQLWKDGPKFAKCNYGASSQSETSKGTSVDFETAGTSLWGSNWKTPSQSEMDLLNTTKVSRSYCQEGGVYGFKFTGVQDGFTDNSIFLPTGGEANYSSTTRYWSSTDNCLFLSYVEEDYCYWNSVGPGYDCYVRLILN